MRIRLEDSVALPTGDVHYLTDHLVRFQFAQPREVSPYQRLVLEGGSDTDSIWPEAPNREAVRHNFKSLITELDNALHRLKNSWFTRIYKIASRQDLLRFNVDHHCNPTYVYTNGQAFVSLVSRNAEWFEIAHHPVPQYFLNFNSEYGPNRLIDPENVGCGSSLSVAERAVRGRLSALRVRSVPLRRGSEIDNMLLQCAGETTGADGYPVQTYVAWFRGTTFFIRESGKNEPYRVLNELRPDGFKVDACATCVNFRFTGMSHDFSGGAAGYCKLRHERQGDPRRDEPSCGMAVSVYDLCPDYSFVEDKDRIVPWIRP